MKPSCRLLLGAAALSLASFAHADVVIEMHAVSKDGVGKPIGKVVATQSKYGVVFTPMLEGLPSRGTLHGFHVHQNPSCEPAEKNGKVVAALSAGGHYDPKSTNRHSFPWGTGHLGDLPALYVDQDGKASSPVLAPRLKLSDLKGRALMIHAGGDNYSDEPKALGGGGPRVACGVIR
ncbi:superoxide dismutase family protein [Microbulbifer yueqingensis]|uniref:Superoxide dismutase [Cu-Zn] n=1 Tax=Microbulbifer yueqingensis TaxID=658219 RepID=A0A1G8V082_9GAMM|nr:superoxide dismutase family protein [Microbulbifer yueqingensis]SDJ59264.1 superoxide dismutase, Cu-Zn family [Microbulbifer yueqingensis]